MSVMTDLRKTVTENKPVYAVVGATDLAVAKVREVQHRASSARTRIDVKALPATLQHKAQEVQAQAQQAPTLVRTKALETAGRAEEAYVDLTARGKKLVDRIAHQASTQELVSQGKRTISRGKAVVTTVRRGSTDVASSAKSAVTTVRRDVAEAVTEPQQSATRTAGTKRTTKRASTTTTKRATTVAKRAARAKSEVKATATSARKTAAAAEQAVEAAAEKIGD